MSQTALYSQVIRLAGDSGQPQGSAASAIVRDDLQRAPFSQQQPKCYFKFLSENHPSGFSPHLEVVGLNWEWVVNTLTSSILTINGINYPFHVHPSEGSD